MTRLLSGYRIIESSMLLNGATTSMMLVDLGAELIKVESPFLGDYIRAQPAHPINMHLQVNKGKRSIALDLRKPQGREVMYRLVETADVFVTNAVGSRNEKLGIGYHQLKALKNDIIYCQNTGYGAEGAYSQMPTHGQMMDSMAGAFPMEMGEDGLTRLRQSELRAPFSLTNAGSGTATGAIYAAFHIAAALAHPDVIARARQGLLALKAQGGGSSSYATRALLMSEPHSIDGGEITDKGYTNQRAVLLRRAALVEQLHAGGPGVITL